MASVQRFRVQISKQKRNYFFIILFSIENIQLRCSTPIARWSAGWFVFLQNIAFAGHTIRQHTVSTIILTPIPHTHEMSKPLSCNFRLNSIYSCN